MTINRTRLITIGMALILGVCLEGAAFAQSNCKEVKGQLLDVFTAGAFSGTITNAGDLDGTSTEIFTGTASTPVPSIVFFSADFTLTTHEGQLKASWVNLFDNTTSLLTVMVLINPTASTGRFAGATGVLYINGKAVSFAPFTVAAELAGQLCYAKQ
jgi:hypothetical protein